MVQASPGGISGDSESDNKLTLINGEVILLPQVLLKLIVYCVYLI